MCVASVESVVFMTSVAKPVHMFHALYTLYAIYTLYTLYTIYIYKDVGEREMRGGSSSTRRLRWNDEYG